LGGGGLINRVGKHAVGREKERGDYRRKREKMGTQVRKWLEVRREACGFVASYF
jgi:hypothetical protein